jgi:hypothetical protein
MVRIFPPDKLEMGVRMSGMRARISLLDCTESFTARARPRERCVITSSCAIVRLSRKNQGQIKRSQKSLNRCRFILHKLKQRMIR